MHWRQIGHVLTRPGQLPLEGVRSSGGIYAPTIRYHEGIVLHVQATKERYTFAYTAAAGELQRLATGETRYLATEVAGGFTGVYLAMFASGVGARACFEWFEYRA